MEKSVEKSVEKLVGRGSKRAARDFRIIGAASGAGAQDPGCAAGPQAFHHSQAWQTLSAKHAIHWGATLFAPQAGTSAQRIAGLCRKLAAAVEETLAAGEFPLVLGGDHSVAIGTWSGVARHLGQVPGLLWIDAHLDSHTPASSYTGAVHGMPLACLLGQGDKRFLQFGLPERQIDPARSVVFGARSFEPEECRLLERLGVQVITAAELASEGFAAGLDRALGIVTAGGAAFGVTLDLDAIDPVWAPGVGSPEPEGLRAEDLRTALAWIASLPGFTALEIVEYNPDRDRFASTAQVLADLLESVIALAPATAHGGY